MSDIRVDRSACEGYANCVLASSDYFDLDDDDVVVLLRTSPDDTDLDQVRRAAASCPVNAITVGES